MRCLVLVLDQILRVAEIEKKDDVKRPYIRQLLEPGLKFPLPHRREFRRVFFHIIVNANVRLTCSSGTLIGTTSKGWFAANRPATWA